MVINGDAYKFYSHQNAWIPYLVKKIIKKKLCMMLVSISLKFQHNILFLISIHLRWRFVQNSINKITVFTLLYYRLEIILIFY